MSLIGTTCNASSSSSEGERLRLRFFPVMVCLLLLLLVVGVLVVVLFGSCSCCCCCCFLGWKKIEVCLLLSCCFWSGFGFGCCRRRFFGFCCCCCCCCCCLACLACSACARGCGVRSNTYFFVRGLCTKGGGGDKVLNIPNRLFWALRFVGFFCCRACVIFLL